MSDGTLSTRSFDLEAPWRWHERSEFDLILHDRGLIGSTNHMIRIDLYPMNAPSHPTRHIGYWDIPLGLVKRNRTALMFRDGALFLKRAIGKIRIEPAWRGNMDPFGYCQVNVSLWNMCTEPHEQLEVQSFQHLVTNGDRDLPLEVIRVGVTQRCNLLCPSCVRQSGTEMEQSDVSREVLDPILDAAADVWLVSLQGIGEPLLNENVFTIADQFRKRMPTAARLATTTNGVLMDGNAAARLIDLGVNSVTFSVDGATKSVYERYRPGADFDLVTSNIARMVEYGRKSGRGDLWISVNFLMLEGNVHEVPAVVSLAASLGLDCIVFLHERDFPSGVIRTLPSVILEPLVAEAMERAERYGIRVLFPRLSPSRENRCPFMQFVSIAHFGEALPCCRLMPRGILQTFQGFGNVRKISMWEIWDLPEYREFRRRVVSGTLPDQCAGCDYCRGLIV